MGRLNELKRLMGVVVTAAWTGLLVSCAEPDGPEALTPSASGGQPGPAAGQVNPSGNQAGRSIADMAAESLVVAQVRVSEVIPPEGDREPGVAPTRFLVLRVLEYMKTSPGYEDVQTFIIAESAGLDGQRASPTGQVDTEGMYFGGELPEGWRMAPRPFVTRGLQLAEDYSKPGSRAVFAVMNDWFRYVEDGMAVDVETHEAVPVKELRAELVK
jgi:hypothetical protein